MENQETPKPAEAEAATVAATEAATVAATEAATVAATEAVADVASVVFTDEEEKWKTASEQLTQLETAIRSMLSLQSEALERLNRLEAAPSILPPNNPSASEGDLEKTPEPDPKPEAEPDPKPAPQKEPKPERKPEKPSRRWL
jgi:hypothetical protein